MGYYKKSDTKAITNSSFVHVVYDAESSDTPVGWTAATEEEYNTYNSSVLPGVLKEIETKRIIQGMENYGVTSAGTISIGDIYIVEGSFSNQPDLNRFTGSSSIMPPIFAKEASSYLGSNKYIGVHPNIDAILYAFDKANVTDIPYVEMSAFTFLSLLQDIKHKKEDIGETISNGLTSQISDAQGNLSNNDKTIDQTWAQHKSQFSISTE